METVSESVLRLMILVRGEIVVRDVGGEVHREANAHDKDDHTDDIKVDSQERHHSQDPNFHGEDSKDDPNDTNFTWDEHEDDDGHDGQAETHAEDSLIEDLGELVKNEEHGVE